VSRILFVLADEFKELRRSTMSDLYVEVLTLPSVYFL
jgi:hypothetical protein